MDPHTPNSRKWTLEDARYPAGDPGYLAAAAVAKKFAMQGEETRILCRPDGCFQVKHRTKAKAAAA